MTNISKKASLALALWLAGMLGAAAGQNRQGGAFYQPSRELRIEGVIRRVTRESKHRNTSRFLLVEVEVRGTGEVYLAELCPVWFCEFPLNPEESIVVTGALVHRDNETLALLAREIEYGGRLLRLRDKNGFPLWRGGRGRNRRRRIY